MDFAGYSIPECNVSFEALPSLLVECCPNTFEGWEVLDDFVGTGYFFQSVGGCKVLSVGDMALVIALCKYVKCDAFLWVRNEYLCLHFSNDHTPLY